MRQGALLVGGQLKPAVGGQRRGAKRIALPLDFLHRKAAELDQAPEAVVGCRELLTQLAQRQPVGSLNRLENGALLAPVWLRGPGDR